MTKGRSSAGSPGVSQHQLVWLLFWIGCIGTAILVFPRESQVYRADDWDFLDELTRMSLWEFVARPNSAGHVLTLFKLIYGTVYTAFNYDPLPLLIFQFGVRAATVWLWVAILRSLNWWLVPTVACLLAVFLSEAGMLDVFQYDLQCAQEMSILAASAAIYSGIRYLQTRRQRELVILAISSILGAFGWGIGLVPLVALPAAYLLIWKGALQRGQEVEIREPLIAFVLSPTVVLLAYLAVHLNFPDTTIRKEMGEGGIARVAAFFLYGTIVNSAPSGWALHFTPGIVNLLFFVVLCIAAIWFFQSDNRVDRKFCVISLMLMSVGIGLLIAIGRSKMGIQQAGSYRYAYNHVFFQTLAVGMLVQAGAERLANAVKLPLRSRQIASICGLLILLVATVGGIRGARDLRRYEMMRRECLAAIDQGRATREDLSELYYRDDLEFVTRVWREVSRRRVAAGLSATCW
jgi:hypothetical protein